MLLVPIAIVSVGLSVAVAVDSAARLAWRMRVRRLSRTRLDDPSRPSRDEPPSWVGLLSEGGEPQGRAMVFWIEFVGRALERWMFRGEPFHALLRRSGLVAAMERDTFVTGSARWAIAGAVIGGSAGSILGAAGLGIIAGVLLAGASPALLLRRAARIRSEAISAELPGMIDLVSLGLEAGLSLERSLDLYAKRRRGALSDELQESERIARIAVLRREKALGQVAALSGSDAFVQFAAVVSQSTRLGTPLVAILDTESAKARASHRSLVEARIARAPIRMIVPLGVFILPAMILIVVGPMAATFVGV